MITIKTETKKNGSVVTLILVITFMIGQLKSQTRLPWLAPKDVCLKVNPIKPDPTSLKEAKVLYLNTCGPCHGDKGKGDGIAAVACDPKPADHTSNFVQQESDGSLFWKISEGRGPMPSYKTTLTLNQKWLLVNYIRTLKAKEINKK
jgi:mono/diheme cytochrome c family protein